MGDIADMMIEGFLDEETGEVIDFDAPGYPRSLAHGNLPSSDRRMKNKARKARKARRLSPAAKAGLSAIGKAQCPKCGKRVKVAGLKDHLRDKHGVFEASPPGASA